MNETETIRWERDDDGVVVLTLDDPTQAVNTMNAAYSGSMEAAVARLEAERDEIAGVVLTSGKRTFFAGGDLNELAAVDGDEVEAFAARLARDKGQLRRLEKLGRPVVAAVAGAALGGGLEIVLAAHHRIVVDDPSIKLGTPEVGLGLLPGAGGIARGVRLMGISPALTELLLEGRNLSPRRARDLGLIDELIDRPEDLIGAAKAWIAANPEPTQPWDRPGFSIPGGSPADPAFAPILQTLPSRLRKKLKGAKYPAPAAILAAAVEGAQVDFESALEIESRYFIQLVTDPVAKNMIHYFFDLQRVRGRDEGTEAATEFTPRTAAVLGAGMMGSGIAYACAKAGIEVVLTDVDADAAERGRAYSQRVVDREVGKGRMDEESGRALVERIVAASDPAAAAGAELMIEAVFEDRAIKSEVYGRIEPRLHADALLASNTSTLPIGDLATAVTRPADFVGLHFFSPVDRMDLVEVVVGEQTSEESVRRALDVTALLGKTPIVVNDSRGFFTSRVIGLFIDEGTAMLAEGIPAASIEQASSQAGYPTPVLRLADELNLNLARMIREEKRRAAEAEGVRWNPHPADAVIDRMLDEFDRGGRLAGAGYYHYEDGRRVGIWPGLAEAFGADAANLPPFRDLVERLLFIEAIESIRCLEENVIRSVAEANVGSILGIGYPRWTGGVIQFADGYEGGVAGFVARAEELATAYGPRFSPPPLALDLAHRGASFDDEYDSALAAGAAG